MKIIIGHNEGKKNVYLHSINCRRVKGVNKYRYSYCEAVDIDEKLSWEENAKYIADGFEVLHTIWLVPDKCLNFPDAKKIKLKYENGKWIVK